MSDDVFADVVPERTRQWFADHPRVLFGVCVALLGFTAVNFYRATELVIRARDLVGETQIAASEALGG